MRRFLKWNRSLLFQKFAKFPQAIPMPKWWLPVIAGTIVLSVTALIGLAEYLEGRKPETHRAAEVSRRDP